MHTDTEDDQDKVAKILAYGYCSGSHCKGHGIAEPDHPCPYAEDIHNDHTTMCNCCQECQYECAMDI